MISEPVIAGQIAAMIHAAPDSQEKEAAIEYFSQQLASIIANAIRSGQVITNPGQPVLSGILPGATSGPGTGFIQ